MATIVNEVSIRGLRKQHFEQLRYYLFEASWNNNHYGNGKQFYKRADDLYAWLNNVIELLEQDRVKIEKNKDES